MTLPSGASSSSACCRCSSLAKVPAEITDMASSTSAGVLDITRTTGTSPVQRRSMNDVVIPAAIEITSWDGPTRLATSSSIRSMSCGLTAITSVSAFAAASATLSTGTP